MVHLKPTTDGIRVASTSPTNGWQRLAKDNQRVSPKHDLVLPTASSPSDNVCLNVTDSDGWPHKWRTLNTAGLTPATYLHVPDDQETVGTAGADASGAAAVPPRTRASRRWSSVQRGQRGVVRLRARLFVQRLELAHRTAGPHVRLPSAWCKAHMSGCRKRGVRPTCQAAVSVV